MAPSRRKGSSKAAAAAAARRQWKVGDLVLAKVKGFPAWPATVSEPEKWGYSTDWKKVLVYFFGTQQIAFCNPADVEPFTEEKKQSLLVKRHGKGADFVRAVQEIVESYEKLRKQEQDDGCEDVAHKNEGNSVDFSSKLGSKSQLEAPEATFDSQINSSHSTADGNEPRHHAENTSATAHKDAVDGNEEPSDSAAVTEIPLRTISRKRSKDLPFQNGISQRKDTMVRRSRSSSRLESRRLRGSTVQCNDSGKGAGDLSPTVAHDGLLQRNKQRRQSTDASESDVVDLSAFVSSGSTEDIGSEIVTIESDTLSFNEGSAIDSGCKIEHSETLVGYVDGDVELSKGLDLQIKAVIKKKRKPNRKRPINDAVEPTGTVDKEAGVQNTSESSRNACEKMNGSCSKDDGDEHLPLVKRARVRMGESSLKEPNNSLSNTEENLQKEVTVHTAKTINKSSRCDDSTGRDSLMIHAVLDASPSRGTQLPENKPQLWKRKKEQSFGCSVDGEAALPPSKRLHRALEAMSANAAEEDQSHNDVSSGLNRLTNVQSISPMRRSPDISMTLESKIACEVVQQNVDLTGSNAQGAEVSGLATSFNTIAVKNDELFQETCALNKKLENPNTQNNKSGEECFLNARYADEKNPCGGSSGGELAATAVPTQSLRYLSSSPDRKESDVRSVQGSADELSLSTDKGNAKGVELINNTLDKREHELETCKCTAGSMDTVSDMPDDIGKVSPQCGTGVDCMSQLNTQSIVCENTRFSEPPLDDNRDEKDMSEVVTELVNKQREEDHLSSPSFPNDHLGEDLATHSSPFLTDGGDSLAQASPANVSLGHVSTSDNSSFLQNNGSCSPDVHLHDKITSHPSVVDEEGKFESVVTQRSKFLGKYAEAIAALSSFEAMLGTLTRTKESIGRATRVAIDCAKFGVSSKVVDVLARCLETESSLHRRVDLFFLVDSIVKGDVGGWYPAAIQAVLPRLLAAAAPPGNSAHENRRQCLKVLRLWLERKILPESIIRRHMRELDSYGCCPSGAFSRRSMRTERSLDDPLREMEGMLVDEYGSNSSFQLPGFCMPSMLKDEDEGSDSDGGSFEAVTPEHSPDRREDHEKTPAVEKHRHILEDVDGELEMEDVAPSCEMELTSSSGAIGDVGAQNSQSQFEMNMKLSFAPPLPQDVPPSSPPLPSSPPPPPPPAMHPPSAVSAPYANGTASKLYAEAHNMQDTMVQSVAQQSNAPRSNHYHPSECRDHQRQMPESFPGPNFHNKGYPLRPPHPPPSNQFSYVREEQHFKPRREGVPPPLYSNRHHFVQNWDRENFYNNHERMKQAPHEHHDGWRFPPHSFSGPQYPAKGKSFGPVPFVGPPSEQTRFPDQGWRFPPRSMSHRDSMPFRPPLEGPIPVSSRGPGFWRPR